MRKQKQKRNAILAGISGLLSLGALLRVGASVPMPYTLSFTPGTQTEWPYLQKIYGAVALPDSRHAEQGQFWVYGMPVAPGSRCRILLTLGMGVGEAAPTLIILGPDNKQLPIRLGMNGADTLVVEWTVPAGWTAGTRLPVIVSAKDAPFTLKQVRFQQILADSNGDGLPDGVAKLMQEGLPPAVHPVSLRTNRPFTVTQTPQAVTPNLDLQTDSLFVYNADAGIINSWKTRGYTVWTMGGSRDGKDYADKHKDEVQTTATGELLSIGDSFYLSPTANRLAVERSFYETALSNGSDGICPEEPEYWARAGYEQAFQQAWQAQYHTPWQDPSGSVDARWKAGQLMATLEANHIANLLQDASQKKPGARRMVALHSPVSYAEWNIISPHYRITSLPLVQDVIGQVWTGTARTPARYAGIRSDRTFSTAYLEYSSLVHLLRGTGKRLWFLTDPMEDNQNLSLADYKSHYEQTLIASLLFPDVDSYEVMPWPERVYGHVPEAYATEINSVVAALQDMHRQGRVDGNAQSNADIGVLISDTMQWQREAPNASDFDGFFGLTLPLLQRGVPVQVVSLDRAAEPNYLNRFKTLLLSYDFQKPPNPQAQQALSDWVKRGGSLLFFGGSDAYNSVSDAWWRIAKQDAPQQDLWNFLNLPVGGARAVSIPQEDPQNYKTVQQSDDAKAAPHSVTLDLTTFAHATGCISIRFSGGAAVSGADLRVDNNLAASFQAGSEVENRFIVYDNQSQFANGARMADQNASWTYRFENLPKDKSVTLTITLGGSFQVAAASSLPDFGHTLLGADADSALVKAFPRLRIGSAYTATVFPQLPQAGANPAQGGATTKPAVLPAPNNKPTSPTVLYTLRSGGAAVWAQKVDRGLMINVGVAPSFFASSERSASLLRGLTQYANQRVGGTYREAGALRLNRGKYTIVRTLNAPETVEGRTIDLLSPTLPVMDDRTIPPHSLALLYDIGVPSASPHIGFVSGRLDARLETSDKTVFFVRGPQGTKGAARLHAGNRKLTGVRATDYLGRPVPIQDVREGGTVLFTYANDPDGVIIHAGWQ